MNKTKAKHKANESVSQMLLRAADCARLCGVSRRTWFRLDTSLRTPASIRLGGSPVWRREDLDLWISWDCPSRNEFETRMESQNAK